jgi:hypothetical protein
MGSKHLHLTLINIVRKCVFPHKMAVATMLKDRWVYQTTTFALMSNFITGSRGHNFLTQSCVTKLCIACHYRMMCEQKKHTKAHFKAPAITSLIKFNRFLDVKRRARIKYYLSFNMLCKHAILPSVQRRGPAKLINKEHNVRIANCVFQRH